MSDDVDVVVHTEAEARALIEQGAVLQRHAHQMRLRLPIAAFDHPEFRRFHPDGTPPVPWTEVLPAFSAAYPPEHPDHIGDDADLIDTYLIPYTTGARLGRPFCDASAIAVRDGHAYGGILVVDRPGEGPWVCDIWRDPSPSYSGAGVELLRWAASRLADQGSLGLVVTVGNDRALTAYRRVGFEIESTAWRLRAP